MPVSCVLLQKDYEKAFLWKDLLYFLKNYGTIKLHECHFTGVSAIGTGYGIQEKTDKTL